MTPLVNGWRRGDSAKVPFHRSVVVRGAPMCTASFKFADGNSVLMSRSSMIVAATWLAWRGQSVLGVRPRGVDSYFLPGGVPEPGETLAEAAAREVREEVRMIVEPTNLVEVVRVDDVAFGRPDHRVLLVCFEGPGTGEPVADRDEIVEVAWLGRDDWIKFAPAVQKALTERTR